MDKSHSVTACYLQSYSAGNTVDEDDYLRIGYILPIQTGQRVAPGNRKSFVYCALHCIASHKPEFRDTCDCIGNPRRVYTYDLGNGCEESCHGL